MLVAALATLALSALQAPPQAKLSPELAAAVAAAGTDERVPVYALLRERLGAAELKTLHAEHLPRGARQTFVAGALRARADRSAAGVMALLAELEAGGSAGRVRPVWIAGAVAFEGTPAAVRAVALLPEVLRLGWDAPRPLAEIEDAPAACPAPPGVPGPTPNLVEVQAPQLWALGMTGQGIRILNIDGGTDVTHPDLAGSVWTNPFDPLDGVDNDGNGYVDDLHGWDFVDGDNNPSPAGFDAHGTNTAGILVGDGTSSGSPTGMAPDAELAVARVNTEVDHWLALQYAVGTAMDCTSSSYSYKWGTFPKPDYHTHRDVQVVLLAAGIIHVNSIGNQGGAPEHPVPFQIAVPGSVPGPWRHPIQAQLLTGLSAALGCGAVELGGGQYSLSSLGPSAWEDVKLYSPSYGFLQNPAYWDYPVGGFVGDQQGLIKPDLVAPTNVQTTAPGGGYSTFGGTSAATPHLGGACALLRSAAGQGRAVRGGRAARARCGAAAPAPRQGRRRGAPSRRSGDGPRVWHARRHLRHPVGAGPGHDHRPRLRPRPRRPVPFAVRGRAQRRGAGGLDLQRARHDGARGRRDPPAVRAGRGGRSDSRLDAREPGGPRLTQARA